MPMENESYSQSSNFRNIGRRVQDQRAFVPRQNNYMVPTQTETSSQSMSQSNNHRFQNIGRRVQNQQTFVPQNNMNRTFQNIDQRRHSNPLSNKNRSMLIDPNRRVSYSETDSFNNH